MTPDTDASLAADVTLGSALDRWLAHLDDQGFRVGVRERLQVHALLARLAAQGELPAELHEVLALAAPLLCGSREQQRHYARLLAVFVNQGTPQAPPPPPPAVLRRAWWPMVAGALGVLAVLAALGAWRASLFAPEPAAVPVSPMGKTDTVPVAAPALSFMVQAQALPLQPAQPPAWSTPARVATALVSLLVLGLVGATAEAARRRRMAMAGVRTDDELDEHLLREAVPTDIGPPPALARTVARALRQRVSGEARALDLRASLRATVTAQGAFTPRWRQLHRTPEYLALVDCRHPHDHHAALVLAQLDALARAGVALQVWLYETSPAGGCWLHGGHGNHDALTRRRVPLAALVARSAGQRLLVFGPADVLQHPLTGALQPWAASLLTLAERAWITPQPAHAWGAPEELADGAGFLVLPLQESALTALAGWFSSGRPDMALDPDTPASVPALLGADPLAWVTRRQAPPPETVAALLRQLRAMLGGLRFQWLCGCAVFPQLTPALTVALGCLVLPDPRARALGLAAFSALPWFRWGRLPDWLRQALLAELAPDLRARFAAEVHQRLDRALQAGDGPVLADVATRRRRLLGALRQRRGPLRDAVLADFVRADTDLPLAQHLPEGLRRRLFRHGDAAEGLRWPLQAAAVAGLVALLVAVTPAWTLAVGSRAQPPLARVGSPTTYNGWSADFAAELRTVGESIVAGRARDGRIALINFAPDDIALQVPADTLFEVGRPLATTSAQGYALELQDGGVQLRAPDGQALGTPLGPLEPSPVIAAAFTASGGRVIGLLANGRWATWGLPWDRMPQREAVVACGGGSVDSPLATQVARAIATDGRSAPVIFSGDAAAQIGLPAVAAGQVLRSSTYDAARATLIAQQLQHLATGLPQPAWQRPAVAPQLTRNQLLIGACLEAGAPPPSAPDPATGDPLQQQVQRLFSADAAERTRTAAALVADPVRLSQAVTPALTLALARQAQAPVVEPALSGIYNTLVLARAAPPATLRRESDRLQQLVQQTAANGEKTALLGREVLARLKQAQGLLPLIYLQIADEAQRPLAEQLTQRLTGMGLKPQGIENIGSRAPAMTELRVQGFSDRPTATRLALALAPLGPSTTVGLPQNPANDTYEIWLARDLCVKQTVRGCGQAAGTAPVPTASAAAAQALPGPSDNLVEMVMRFEGLVDGDPATPLLEPFIDAVGYWIIGYGHPLSQDGRVLKKDGYPDSASLALLTLKLPSGQTVLMTEGITPAQARELLRADLAGALAQVDTVVKVPLAAHQREALADFVFNLGPAPLQASTLLRKLNAGDLASVPDELMRWDKAGGKTISGATRRRAAEAALWQGREWRSAAIPTSAKQ